MTLFSVFKFIVLGWLVKFNLYEAHLLYGNGCSIKQKFCLPKKEGFILRTNVV